MLNDAKKENVYSGEVLTDVMVEVTKPQPIAATAPNYARAATPATVKAPHGTIRLTDKKSGVFETVEYTVTLKKDPGGPIDEKWFQLALERELMGNEKTAGSFVTFQDFVGLDYIQGFNGKFLGTCNERFRVMDLRREIDSELYGYDLQIKGIYSPNREPRPFLARLALETSLHAPLLAETLIDSQRILNHLDVAICQELNKRLPGVDLIESVSIIDGNTPVIMITHLNKDFYHQAGTVIGDGPIGEKMEVWVAPALTRR